MYKRSVKRGNGVVVGIWRTSMRMVVKFTSKRSRMPDRPPSGKIGYSYAPGVVSICLTCVPSMNDVLPISSFVEEYQAFTGYS
eukprot:scaffold236_cov245-Amphora_coffeaeformis.AAC.7